MSLLPEPAVIAYLLLTLDLSVCLIVTTFSDWKNNATIYYIFNVIWHEQIAAFNRKKTFEGILQVRFMMATRRLSGTGIYRKYRKRRRPRTIDQIDVFAIQMKGPKWSLICDYYEIK